MSVSRVRDFLSWSHRNERKAGHVGPRSFQKQKQVYDVRVREYDLSTHTWIAGGPGSGVLAPCVLPYYYYTHGHGWNSCSLQRTSAFMLQQV